MADEVMTLGGFRCLVLADSGPLVGAADTGRVLVEAAMGERVTVVVVPVLRFEPAFFQLRSGIAGEVIQKVLNYKFKFAVVGDVSAYIAASDSLRDFVVECNRGRDIFFAPDLEALGTQLAALHSSAAGA